MNASSGKNGSDTFITFHPRNEDLKKHIAYYYLHYSDQEDFHTSFNYYPHYRNAITVYLDANIIYSDEASRVTPGQQDYALFSRNYDRKIHVEIHGPFKKLGIAFEPLGISHFTERPLHTWAENTVNDFTLFKTEPVDVAKQIYSVPTPDVDLCATYLDAMLIKRLNHFHNEILIKALDQLQRLNEDMDVSMHAERLGISRKTLLRHFRTHLNCSVKTYQNLIRFRRALNNYYESDKELSFSRLAVDHNYYDQPAFIKHFKSITGYSPRNFFEKLKKYGSQDTYWSS